MAASSRRFPTDEKRHSPGPAKAEPADVVQENHVTNSEECNRDLEEESKIKTRLLTMWNNARYSWNFKSKTHFAKDSPIWLLGRIYHQTVKNEDTLNMPANNFEALKSDFYSRIW